MPALNDTVLTDVSPQPIQQGRARALLLAANNAVDRVLTGDSAAFVEQNRQHEGE